MHVIEWMCVFYINSTRLRIAYQQRLLESVCELG